VDLLTSKKMERIMPENLKIDVRIVVDPSFREEDKNKSIHSALLHGFMSISSKDTLLAK
jgi:hypothetical protein